MPRRINHPLPCLLVLALLASCARPRQPAPQKTPPPPPPAQTAPASGAPYGFVYTPPPDAQDADSNTPRILEIDLNDHVLDAPGPIRVRVLTNPAVNSVIVGTMGRQLAVPQTASGVFSADDQMPNIPFFLRNRTYDIQFIASTPYGRTTTVTIPVTLR
jgi:hypothetical protein